MAKACFRFPFPPQPSGAHLATGPLRVLFAMRGHEAGGAERHLVQLMQGLRSQGVECMYAGPRDGWLGEQLHASGFPCWHVSYRGIYDLASLFEMMRLIREFGIHIVHSHMSRATFYAGWAARFTGRPCVASVHSMLIPGRYGRSTRIVAVSHAVHRYLLQHGFNKRILRTVRNGVPDYAAHPATDCSAVRRSLQLDDDEPIITLTARLDPVKGHDIALRALALLADRRWTCLFAGAAKSEWAESMRKLAVSLGLTSRVRFLGHSDDIASIYSITDIQIAPSRREALSLTLLEASAFGIPIVASRVDGIVESVADGHSGILVPAEDETALAKAIAGLLDSPKKRREMGLAGRQHYERYFSVETMSRNMIEIYRECLDGPVAGQTPVGREEA